MTIYPTLIVAASIGYGPRGPSMLVSSHTTLVVRMDRIVEVNGVLITENAVGLDVRACG